jgi:drug/metabolite transporter (DMT)-like permease
VVYAIWSGVGIVLVSVVAWQLYGQKLDLPAIIGMAMIIGGVLVLNLFSLSRALTQVGRRAFSHPGWFKAELV